MNPLLMPHGLNAAAAARVDRLADDPSLGIEVTNVAGAAVFDFGVNAAGGLRAGLELSRICLADRGEVVLDTGRVDGRAWPFVSVTTDDPLAACLLSQYAGWQVAVGKFFGMGSGPMRAVARVEPLFEEFPIAEAPDRVVGVLESGRLPDDEVIAWLSERLRTPADRIVLCVARTASLAGTVQVVARSVETALHKLHELRFDVTRIVSGFGTAPLPPVAADDMAGIGLTNDAILYGGSVTLWVTGDDESIAAVGPQVPAGASRDYGRPFVRIFEDAGRDFYKIDPLLFSPAELTFVNRSTGRVHRFGRTDDAVLKTSFGLG